MLCVVWCVMHVVCCVLCVVACLPYAALCCVLCVLCCVLCVVNHCLEDERGVWVLVCREIGECAESDRGCEPIEGLQVCQEDVGPGAACEGRKERRETEKEKEEEREKEKTGEDWEGFTRTMVRDEELLE